MAPQPAHTIDHTPEYAEFIASLRDYHARRGTHFEPEPKVGQTPVDLLKLFKLIVSNGGYDKVSEEKLAWRNMVNTLELYSNNEASAAYSLKLAYYKNLAAYEITTIHKQEPPPPEILEHISAKGGGLLTRTLENFGGHRGLGFGRPSGGGSSGGGASFDTPHHSGDDMGTPTRDHDGTPLSGRASRGLREAPPQRVIFQPDTGSSRQARHASASIGAGTPTHPGQLLHHAGAGTPQGFAGRLPHQQYDYYPQHQVPQQMQMPMPLPPQRGASLLHNPPGSDVFSPAVQKYEPRGPVPIFLQPVEAPATVPAKYVQQQRLQRLEASGVSLSRFATRPPVPPGNEGPNIYVRCLSALRSGIAAEEAFALSHLVKISYERGDKYKFESFPGLAEGLLEKALQVGSLFYHDIQWTISYDPESSSGGSNTEPTGTAAIAALGELDGVNGTPDILERIAQLRPREDTLDGIQTEEFADQLVLVTEAALTLRNMVTLQENAYYLSDVPACRDFLCIALNLPPRDTVVELKHCALDIAEQLTPYLTLGDDDPLYQTLLGQLASADRGTVLTALRALGRISMNLAQTNRLGRVPASVLQHIAQWLLLNDDELMDACLDFLYQYTAVSANVERLLQAVQTEHLVRHLVRLLSHGARRGYKELVLVPERKQPATETVLAVPADLLARLVATDEPERCYTWLRCFFEEDPDASITQIAIWQAYQSSFLQPVQQCGRTMLGAAEFIRNVTHVFHAAGAQIQKEQTPQGAVVQKFIIKGIRPRVRPISPPEGDSSSSSSGSGSSGSSLSSWREYFPCAWRVPSSQQDAQEQQGAGPAAAANKTAKTQKTQPCGVFFGTAETLYAHILARHVGETPDAEGKVANKTRDCRCLWADCRRYPRATRMPLADFMQHIKTHAVQAEQDSNRARREHLRQQQLQMAPSSPVATASHHRQRSSVSNGDLAALVGGGGGGGGGSTPGAGSGSAAAAAAAAGAASQTPGSAAGGNASAGTSAPSSKRPRRSYVMPAQTISVAVEETATMRDERNPNLPPQAAGIPLSAVLVLRNIARNAAKAPLPTAAGGEVKPAAPSPRPRRPEGNEAGDGEGGAPAAVAGDADGWNERLFRPLLPRLYEIMTENRALAAYIASLFQLIGEEQ